MTVVNVPMNIIKTKEFLKRTLQIPQKFRTTPFIWGPYGIGKSEMIKQLAQELCEKMTKEAIDSGKTEDLFEIEDGRMVAFDPNPIDIRLSLKDSGDIQGLPTFHVDKNGTKRTTWAIPDCFPSDPKWKGIIFFDEFNLAQNINVINACYQILTEFQLEAIKFNPGILIVCAGNYTEIAPNAIDLSQGINSRVNHIDMVPDLDIWINWALDNNINPYIINFLKTQHSDFFFDEDALKNGDRELPNPRAWVRTAAFLDLPNYDAESNLVQDVSGIIGYNRALMLKSFIKDINKYQNPDEIIIEGKDFNSESINGFFVCFINCVSKINTQSDKDLFVKSIDNLYKAIEKLQKKELKAFAAQTMVDNKRIGKYITEENPEIVLGLSKCIVAD